MVRQFKKGPWPVIIKWPYTLHWATKKALSSILSARMDGWTDGRRVNLKSPRSRTGRGLITYKKYTMIGHMKKKVFCTSVSLKIYEKYKYTERKKFSKLFWVSIILTEEYRHTDK